MEFFIREKNGKHYIVHRYYENGKRKEKWVRLEGTNLKAFKNALKVKEELERNSVEVACMNPFCSNKIIMTAEQKRDLLISFKKKYNKAVLVCCSEECRKKVLELLQGK